MKKRNQIKQAFPFILPWLIGFACFVAYPLFRTIYFSFYNVKYSAVEGYIYEWIGVENYKRILFVEYDFVVEIQNFIVRIIAYAPIIIALSIIIAMLLNSKLKGTTVFRLIFFLPIIILNGELMENMRNYGGLNLETGHFIITVIDKVAPDIIVSIIILIFNTILEILWYCGVPILIFLATLQKIDKSLYEAAQIDGASAWNIFWKITLPSIYSLVSVTIVYVVVFLGNFDGNPINQLIQAARFDGSKREGYASAESIIYAFVQTLLIILLYFVFKRREKRRN